MNNYKNLLDELLMSAKGCIDQVNNVSDKFNMSIRLAEQVINAMNVSYPILPAIQEEVVIIPDTEQPVVEEVVEIEKPLTKKEYEKLLGYKISKEAYDEYKDYQKRMANGETFNFWMPDPEGLCPIPADVIVTLAVKENPELKHLFEEKVKEESEVEIEIEEPVEEIAEEPQELTVEEALEVAEDAPEGVEIDIDEDPVQELNCIVEIDGEQIDVTEQYNLMKTYNANLTHDELLERAVDWIEFGINKETYDMLNFIEDESADLIQCKTYLAYYIDAMEIDSIVYYINYFASNIEEDENGEEVYVNEELQLEFLNKDNISAFLEYVQQNQQ